MIWIAILVEGAIENWSDFGILFGIQTINASLGYYEIVKAGDAVAGNFPSDLHVKFPCLKSFTIDLHMETPLESQYDVRMSGNSLLMYI